jgi:hypothetical protein
MVLGVYNKRIEVRDVNSRTGEIKRKGAWKLGDSDGLARFFREHGLTNILCSSSVDFPEDGGLPEDADIGGMIDAAFEKAWGPVV